MTLDEFVTLGKSFGQEMRIARSNKGEQCVIFTVEDYTYFWSPTLGVFGENPFWEKFEIDDLEAHLQEFYSNL